MTDRHGAPTPRPPGGSGRTGEAVGVAERLRGRVAEGIAELLAGAAHPVGDVYVGWHAARDAATCPARYRGQGAEGWAFPGWTAPLAAASVGRGAPAHPPDEADRSGLPPALPDPLPTIRRWMQALRAPAAGSGGGGGPPLRRAPVRGPVGGAPGGVGTAP